MIAHPISDPPINLKRLTYIKRRRPQFPCSGIWSFEMLNKWVVYIIYGIEYFCILVGKFNHFKGNADGSVCNGHHHGCKIQEIIQHSLFRFHFLWLISLGAFQRVYCNPTSGRKLILEGSMGSLIDVSFVQLRILEEKMAWLSSW
jgi:hypothetical protein